MVEKEIDSVCNQYGLKPMSLSDLTLSINYPYSGMNGAAGFKEMENAVYLPLLNDSTVLALPPSLSEDRDGVEDGKGAYPEGYPLSYMQLVLDPEKASAAYLVDFLNSSLGQKIRKAWEERGFIERQEWPASGENGEGGDGDGNGEGDFAVAVVSPVVNTGALTQSRLYLPDRKTQDDILKLKVLIAELVAQLNLFERRLSTYPKDIAYIEEKIELIRESVQLVNNSDYILELIRRGESKKLEFKSTLRMNLMNGKSDRNIEHAVLKTLIAYLNTDGGVLLVGVSNDGEVLGIKTDGFPNEDRFLLHFKQLVKQHIGLAYAPLIEYRLVPVNGKKILEITCRKSDEAVFLKPSRNEEEFYIRIGPSSERLTGSKLIEYVNRRGNGNSG